MNATPIASASAGAVSSNPSHQALRPEAVAVRAALMARGLESPRGEPTLEPEEQRQRIQFHFAEIMKVLGLDLTDDSLAETPLRVAKMYVGEIFGGLNYHQFPRLTVVANKMGCDEMIRIDDVGVSSTCEHHFVAIDGAATVAYIPKDRIIGLSKINRVVAFFAQRPQIQERLTQQVLVALQTLLDTDDVAVSIRATHFCVRARGVMDPNSRTTTTALGGVFKSRGDTRREFLLGLERS